MHGRSKTSSALGVGLAAVAIAIAACAFATHMFSSPSPFHPNYLPPNIIFWYVRSRYRTRSTAPACQLVWTSDRTRRSLLAPVAHPFYPLTHAPMHARSHQSTCRPLSSELTRRIVGRCSSAPCPAAY
ncbi:hypothetical protein GY45DRAFT_1325207 [Cubamyces sp. BRFM 1775]|nr:hypothetical protein GY45DRAFT_1325207 [Cubamyces sp. BRFM 1775]